MTGFIFPSSSISGMLFFHMQGLFMMFFQIGVLPLEPVPVLRLDMKNLLTAHVPKLVKITAIIDHGLINYANLSTRYEETPCPSSFPGPSARLHIKSNLIAKKKCKKKADYAYSHNAARQKEMAYRWLLHAIRQRLWSWNMRANKMELPSLPYP